MSLKSYLVSAFIFIALVGGGLLWLFKISVLAQLLDPSTRDFVLLSAGLFLVVALCVVAFSLWWLAGRLSKPLKYLAYALEAFAKRGERVELPRTRLLPTEIAQLESSFTDLVERVEAGHTRDTEVSRVKSDFISTAAHQLRTPLTGIRWALEALEQTPLTEDQKQLTQNATVKSHELVAIVKTLLDISSIESGKYKYEFAPTDLVSVLEEVVQDFAQLAAKQNVSLIYMKSGETVPLVRADRERIKWVLTNLVENAVRYTPADGSVRVSTQIGPGKLYVLVHDTGIGILASDRNNIFERFFRGGNAISKENEGNGLGLYIARTIATDHGGDLSFDANKDGPGTTFTLSLPIAG
jgi:signal transduction histidine kinase